MNSKILKIVAPCLMLVSASALWAESTFPASATKNAEDFSPVKAGEYVARIGDMKYETIADALAAYQTGDVLVMLATNKITATYGLSEVGQTFRVVKKVGYAAAGGVSNSVTHDIRGVVADSLTSSDALAYSVSSSTDNGVSIYTLTTFTPVCRYVKAEGAEPSYYATLTATTLTASGTYTLLADIAVSFRLVPGVQARDVTLDLNGHALTSTASDVAVLLSRKTGYSFALVDTSAAGGGRLVANPSANAAISVSQASSGYMVTVGEGVTVSGGAILLEGAGPILNLYGTVDVSAISNLAAIQSNGATATDITVNVYEGSRALASVAGVGIFLSPSGTVNIYGGVVRGGTAVYAAQGTVNISGGQLVASGAAVEDYVPPTSGWSVTGDALALVNRSAPIANITGGTLTSENAKAVASYANTSGGNAPVAGFIGAATEAGGALFSDNVSDGLAAGYFFAASETEGYYRVVSNWTIRWKVGDTVLKSVAATNGTPAAVIEALAPAGVGIADGENTGVTTGVAKFLGWSPAYADAHADTDYIAQFEEVENPAALRPGSLRFTAISVFGSTSRVSFEFTPAENVEQGTIEAYRLVYKTSLSSEDAFASDVAAVTLDRADEQVWAGTAVVTLPEDCSAHALFIGMDVDVRE